MNQLNKLCCDILDAAGYNGSLLRMQLPEFKTSKRKEAITAPRTKERQEALERARAAGGVFQVTGGSALNDDDFLIKSERVRLKQQLDDLNKTKKQRELDCQRQRVAFSIIETEKNDSEFRSEELKHLIAWKTGIPCPSHLKTKQKRYEFYLEVKNRPVKKAIEWSAQEEAALVALQQKIESDIALVDTQYSRDRSVATDKAKAMIHALPDEEREAFSQELLANLNLNMLDDCTEATEDLTGSFRADDML